MIRFFIIFTLAYILFYILLLLSKQLITGEKQELNSIFAWKKLLILYFVFLPVTAGFSYFTKPKYSLENTEIHDFKVSSGTGKQNRAEKLDNAGIDSGRLPQEKNLQDDEERPIDKTQISPILSEASLMGLDKNIDSIAESIKLDRSSKEVLREISRNKLLLDRERSAKVRLMMEESQTLFISVADGIATEQDIAAVEIIKAEFAEIAERQKQRDRAFSDSIKNSLSGEQVEALSSYESSIVTEKGIQASQDFVGAMTKYLDDLDPAQQKSIENISSIVSTFKSANNDRNYLGFSLQEHDSSSSKFFADATEHVAIAAEQLDSILSYEQKTRLNFDVNKIRQAIESGQL